MTFGTYNPVVFNPNTTEWETIFNAPDYQPTATKIQHKSEDEHSDNARFFDLTTYIPAVATTNFGKAIDYLRNNTFGKHECAQRVEEALEKAGLGRMRCTENGGNGWATALHYNNILKDHGWTLIAQGDDDDPKIQLRPGDVCIQGNSADDKTHAHAALYDGHQWLSNYKQNHMMAHKGQKVKYFIYRKNV